MLIWVTGLSGTGKSSIASRLRELGHWSVDADDDGMSGWRSKETGEFAPSPPVDQRPIEWLDQFGWSIDVRRVQELSHRSDGRRVFLLGAVDNEDDVLAFADTVICLVADAETLRRRLTTRRTNDFGRAPGDIEAVLSWLEPYEERHRVIGAVMVDATQPLPIVVAEVIAAASTE